MEWAKAYSKVTTWLSKLQMKEINAWRLWLYCNFTNKTPDELLELKKSTTHEAELLLDNFIATADLPNSVKVNVVIAVKSFYKHNYLDLARASGQISLVKVHPYRLHTKEELYKIYRAAQNPRDRALITFVWSTAIARDSLTKIKWKNLEPNWRTQEIPHIALSSDMIKGHGIGKYKGVEQHTFLTPEAKRDLIEYEQWLANVKGVTSKPDDPIFRQTHSPYKAITIKVLNKIAEKLSKLSGVKFIWHDGRRYVETALEEIKIHPNWARKIRGRKVRGEEAPYSRPAIEQLRKAYAQAVPLLQFTTPTDLDYVRQRQEVSEAIMSKILSGESLTEEDRINIRKFGLKFAKKVQTATNGGNIVDCQFKQISETELLEHLKAGWKIVHKLSNGEVIVKW